MMATRSVFNPVTQQHEDAELTVDHNNEIVLQFAGGHFHKFPSAHPDGTPTTAAELDEFIAALEESNKGQIVITPEYEAARAAEKAAAYALIGETPPAPAVELDAVVEGGEVAAESGSGAAVV